MSLYGALFSGVSGLSAQSSAMGAIADNVTNVNTIGYKGTSTQFQTLVTKQVALTKYSAGGVQSKPASGIDVQGLLGATNNSTDLGISGEGLFVVNEAANPGDGDMWAYTRAGSFRADEQGYLKNTGGYYLQGWTLLPYDGSENAATVKINDIVYMKSYKDTLGDTVYMNDNIIDDRNLQAINLNMIGGDATATSQISLGGNLPSGDPIYDPASPEDGGQYSMSSLIYDSLGNPHNVSIEYTKESSNAWGVDIKMPESAAVQVVYSDREVTDDTTDDVYAARGQMEFDEIPENHTYISITDDPGGANEHTYTFEFTTDGTTAHVASPSETTIAVDISTGVVSINDALDRMKAQIDQYVPSAERFSVNGTRMDFEQSFGGAAVTINAVNCQQCIQSAANPNLTTGIPTGIFTVPEIDWTLKNSGKIDFMGTTLADYDGLSVALGNKVYEFTNGGTSHANNIAVAIPLNAGVVDREALVTNLMSAINGNAVDPSRFHSSGISLEFAQLESSQNLPINTTDGSQRVSFDSQTMTDYVGDTITIAGTTYTFTNGAGGATDVDISGVADGPNAPQQIVQLLKASIEANQGEAVGDFVIGDGDTLFMPNSMYTAAITDAGVASISDAGTIAGLDIADIQGEMRTDSAPNATAIDNGTGYYMMGDDFRFNGSNSGEDGGRVPGIRFTSDGTPKYFNVERIEIQWANGAENMNGNTDEGDMISLFMGNENLSDGLTHLSGDFAPGNISQDGAKYGDFAGVSIGEDGVVTALFDNGETRPIAIIPLATFTNPNGLESLTGNSFIETDFSGQPTLRRPGDGGSGTLNAASLENSTVDLGEEFTSMITTQRAYSAAAKIITTTDTMLDELIRIKR